MLLRRANPISIQCLVCQWRAFSTSYRRLAVPPTPGQQQPPKPEETPKDASKTVPAQAAPGAPLLIPAAPVIPEDPALAAAPKSYGRKIEGEFTPIPISRPIGLHYPPEPGQNTGIDPRTYRQRRDDFVDYSKHIERRKELTRQVSKPYFRDWSNMSFHKGKSFLSPPRPFKADVSLYFPNLYGRTLLPDKSPRDTTPTLTGRTSVVAVYANLWAENQTNTFIDPAQNPALDALIKESGGRAQVIRINMEDNYMKSLLIRVFMYGLRIKLGRENWGKYFLVNKVPSDEIKEAIGLLNAKVGYVYLVDRDCRIRWAGSGNSEPGERTGLVSATRRLLTEMGNRLR